jgi:hypothetical protein
VGALLLPVGLVVRDGFGYARSALPNLNDAWWESLRELRAASPPDAIVDAWWPYGYWIEYGAERGVSADGSSLRTRIPHWLGRALMAPDTSQAIGLLRMLSCGSDAAPEAEGPRGAYERLRAAGADGLLAYDLVLALAPLDRAAADRALEAQGYPAAGRAEILEATHCSPRPTYLMLSDHPLRQGDIRYEGNWDPRRAAVAHRLRLRPEADAIAVGVAELGLTEPQARAMYATARSLRSDTDLEEFVAPTTPYFTGWVPCSAQGTSTLVCEVHPASGTSSTLERFTYTTGEGSAERGMLALRERGRAAERSPEALLVADGTAFHEVPPMGATAWGYAVLLDRSGARALFGPPYLIRSVLTRLTKLDGRGLGAFEKVGERHAAGERVMTWRIVWPAS